MHLNHHCQVNPQGNPSWPEAAHVLYPKPGAWPVTSVQACTEETETQQLIHFPPQSSCVQETPPCSGDQLHLQSRVTSKKGKKRRQHFKWHFA